MDVISVPPDTMSIIIRLLIATLLGGAIGLNREMVQKPAGLRTHALVSLGAALVTIVGLYLTQQPGGGDVTATGRVVQGLFAGVGFIGGGVILRRHESEVHGLTTAASVWIVAAVGTAAGAGMWRSGTAAIALALLVLVVGGPIDRVVRSVRGKARDSD